MHLYDAQRCWMRRHAINAWTEVVETWSVCDSINFTPSEQQMISADWMRNPLEILSYDNIMMTTMDFRACR